MATAQINGIRIHYEGEMLPDAETAVVEGAGIHLTSPTRTITPKLVETSFVGAAAQV